VEAAEETDEKAAEEEEVQEERGNGQAGFLIANANTAGVQPGRPRVFVFWRMAPPPPPPCPVLGLCTTR
jgi:hypothetical protein